MAKIRARDTYFRSDSTFGDDEMQFSYVPRRDATDAIFVVCQLPGKYITANKLLYFPIIDHQKAPDRVLRKFIWWGVRGLVVSRNGLCVSSKECIPMPGVMCGPMVCTEKRCLSGLCPGGWGHSHMRVWHWRAVGSLLHRWPCAHCGHLEGVYL